MSQVVIVEAPVVVNAPPVTPAVVTMAESRLVVEADSGSCTVAVQDVQALVVAELPAVSVLTGREAVAVVETAVQGLPGVPGPPGSPRIEVPFSFGDATPALLAVAPAGKLVESVRVYVIVPFDGSNPTLTVGDAGNLSRLMTSADNDPATAAGYETTPGISYGADTPVFLSIVQGQGCTQGRGLVVLTIQN